MAILGYNTDGASSAAVNGFCFASHDTADSGGGTTSTIHAYVNNTAGAAHTIKLGIYTDDGVNDPEDLLVTEVEVNVPAGYNGEVSAAYVAVLSANTKYWLAAIGETADIRLHFTTGAGSNIEAYSPISGYVFPDPWGGTANLTSRLSIWAEYSAGGATAYTIEAETGSIVATGHDTELNLSTKINSVLGNIIVNGKNIIQKVSRKLSSITGNILADGKDANLTRGYSLPAETGNIIVTGYSITLKKATIIIAETGNIIVTGYDVNLGNQKNYILTAETGHVIVDGKDINLLREAGIIAETGNIIVTGNEVNLVFSGDDRVYYKVLVTNANIRTTMETVADIKTALETRADIKTILETNGDIG